MKVQIKLQKIRVEPGTPEVLIIPFRLPEVNCYIDHTVRIDLPTTKVIILAAIKDICVDVQQKITRDNQVRAIIGNVPTFDIDLGE
ncbi:hypothetical protein ES705_49921 [subsurface metagenome]